MKTFTQLLRQPVKSAMGILLVAAAVMMLISGVGQQVYTQSTRKSIEYQYDTVALFNKKDFGVQTDMSAEELCDAMIEQFSSMTFSGLTGSNMTWTDGAVSKDPKGMKIENGAYVGM